MANKMKRIINGRVRYFKPVLTVKEIILVLSMILTFILIGLIA